MSRPLGKLALAVVHAAALILLFTVIIIVLAALAHFAGGSGVHHR